MPMLIAAVYGVLCEMKTSIPLPWHLAKPADMKSGIFLFTHM